MNQHYELMYIVPGSVELEHVPAMKSHVSSLLSGAGATQTSEFDMERRRLAYPIGKETYGYYQVVQFDATAPVVRDFDTKLRLDNQLLRYILVKAKPMTSEEIKVMIAGEKYARKRAEPVAVAAAPVKSDTKTDKTSATSLTEAELAFANAGTARVAEVEAEDQKVSIEELDKKLDAILEDTDLDKKL
ncbi:MAG: 30S ribosomal protein S6 [Candidatus Kerfeldbacteria bacterium]|nr:30S ribosomal protein S6 [Candidatus Kerfeldbacteria bacterium]